MIKEVKMTMVGGQPRPLLTPHGRRTYRETTVEPLFEDRVTVRLDPPRTHLGIFAIPDSHQVRTQEGTVTHLGPQAVKGEWGSLSVGAEVVIAAGAGLREEDFLGRDSYMYVRPSDILGIKRVVERIETDEEYLERCPPAPLDSPVLAEERARLRRDRGDG